MRRAALAHPSLLGAQGWRAVLPLSVKCAAFVIGTTVAVPLDELGSRAHSVVRLERRASHG